MNEPNTSVTINDFTVGYGVDPADSRLNILCPIISPSGPTELTRVTGPSMLRRLYFAGSSITNSDHYSAIFDRALVASAPIYVKRGVRNTLRGGKSSSLAEPVYVDSDLNPVSGLKATFSKSSSTDYSSAIANLNGVITDYSNYGDSLTSTQVYVDNSLISSIPVKRVLKHSGESSTSDIQITIGSKLYTLSASDTNFNNLIRDFCLDGICPQGVYDADGNSIRLEYRDDTVSFTDGASIAEIRWFSDLSIIVTQSGTSVTLDDSSSETVDMAKVKTESQYNEEYELSSVRVTVVADNGSFIFYTDSAPTDTTSTLVNLGSGLNYKEVLQGFIRNVAELFGGDSSGKESVVIPNATSISVSSGSSVLSVSSSSINSVEYNDKFAVISAFPCDGDYISVDITNNGDSTYTVTANYSSGEISESWEISFDSGVVDGYGDSLYYQRVNEESEIIRIVELYGDNTTSQSFVIGSQISSSYCDIKEIENAFAEMVDTEESTVMFDYITDGGIVDQSLSSYIVQMCKKYHSFYPASVPTDTTLTYSKVKTVRNALGDYFAMNLIAATQRDSFLDSGSAVYPASLYYLRRRIAIGNSTLEFAPIFAQANGNINMQSPIQKFNTSTRENLLDIQVPTLKREASGLYCVNLNLTCFNTKSYMQEDWVALMINKINQIADVYSKSIRSLPNTESSWYLISTSLSESIKGRLRVGSTYAPVSVRVQCDRTNNTESLIRQNKVRVDIYVTFANSIREVNIYTNVLPIGG